MGVSVIGVLVGVGLNGVGVEVGVKVAVGVGVAKVYSEAGGVKLFVQRATPFDTRNSSIQPFKGNDPSEFAPTVTSVMLVMTVCETVVKSCETPFK